MNTGHLIDTLATLLAARQAEDQLLSGGADPAYAGHPVLAAKQRAEDDFKQALDAIIDARVKAALRVHREDHHVERD